MKFNKAMMTLVAAVTLAGSVSAVTQVPASHLTRAKPTIY